jgi:hypothetical protein
LLRIGIPSLAVVFLLAGTAVPFQQQSNPCTAMNASKGSSSSARGRIYQAKKFECLPKGVGLEEIVSYGKTANRNVTVEKKLIEIKARCRNGKLVDAKNKEIRFFRVSCWGNPPADYLEIQQREHEELEKLQKRYTVIIMGCNPMMM